MPPRAVARLVASLLVSLAAGVALVSGCGGQPSTRQGSPSAAGSSSTELSSASASPTPTDEGSTGTPSASAAAPRTLRDRLLTAGELPGFNTAYRWRQGATAPENPSSSFGTCQRFAITSIGAERVLTRRFLPAGGGASAADDRAGDLVATLPDDLTARRAFAVLKAWRSSCADRLRPQHPQAKVGALTDVRVDGGTAGWYLLTHGPVKGDPNAQFFDAQGMAVVGNRIAMVSMVLAGQDYDYEAGQEPMVAALQRAARKLH